MSDDEPVPKTSKAEMAENALATIPRPDPALLEGGAWARTDYRRQAESRITLRKAALLSNLDLEMDAFRLACRLADDPALRDQLAAIARRPDLAMIRMQLREIEEDERAEQTRALQRCEECGGDGAEPSTRTMRMTCSTCTAAFFTRPSTPPVNGIASALGRARRAKLPATLTDAQWRETVEHFQDRCAFCDGPWCLVEHATPIELGGGTTTANCLPACTSCNVKKGQAILEHLRWERSREALDWLRQRGRPPSS